MAILCVNDCPTAPVALNSYTDSCTTVYRRKEGIRRFLLVRCELQIADLLDTTELQTHITNGDIVASPPGKVTFGAPSVDTFEFDDCGKTEVGESTFTIDFETHAADADLEDYDYFKNLYEGRDQWYIMFEHCEGFFIFDDRWVTAVKAGAPATSAGGSPGFEFSMTLPPYPEKGEGNYTKWTTQFEIKRNGPFCVEYIPGLNQLI